jgi:hypothetical protein
MSQMTIATVIVLFCGGGAWHSILSVSQNDGCPVGLRETLERGGFSGAIFCDKPNAEFSLVGIVVTSQAKYTVYDYRYRFRPEHSSVWHGGQRMIIIRNNEYLGQFVLSPPPVTTIKIHGTTVTFSKPNVEEASVDLAKGVPAHIFFDGDLIDLER